MDKLSVRQSMNPHDEGIFMDHPTLPKVAPERLVSLDAYRGFVMLAMVSGGLGLTEVAEHFLADEDNKFHAFWEVVKYQLEHVEWTGCAAWDLIQPSFMFIVGVAMPFSYASRVARGDSNGSIFFHVVWRAIVLIALGIFLRSNGKPQTNFTFEDVATQIGLGYAFLFLVLGRGWKIQLGTALTILLGYWALFAAWPLPGADFDPAKHGIPDDWNKFTGFAAHWNKYLNPAGYFDQWFLNLFPRQNPFVVNGGGYQTLNFVPSIATMIFGIVTGEWLRSSHSLWLKLGGLFAAALLCLAIGFAVDGYIWPNAPEATWSIAPIVKRIWTPSWAIFSTGWTLLTLSFFVLVIDIAKFRAWSFPLFVVGMNSLAMYVMSWIFKPWVKQTLHTHLPNTLFEGTFGPVIETTMAISVLWLVVYYMYRKHVFIRI